MTLCNPKDCNPRSSSVLGDSLGKNTKVGYQALLQGIFPTQPRDLTQVSCIAGIFFTICATREVQEYWSGKPIPSPGELSDPGIEPGSPALQEDSSPSELHGKPKNVSAAAAAKLLQLCPTQCDPIDGSPLGSSVPGILQARTLEWGAIAFSNCCLVLPNFYLNETHGADNLWEKFVMIWQHNLLECVLRYFT